jgi:hypothetical protein
MSNVNIANKQTIERTEAYEILRLCMCLFVYADPYWGGGGEGH